MEICQRAIRKFIDKGLAINSYSEEITFIRQMTNEEIENIIVPYIKRLIAIGSKYGVLSASSYFALAEVLSKLAEPRYRKSLEEILVENKKLGYAYMTTKNYKTEK